MQPKYGNVEDGAKKRLARMRKCLVELAVDAMRVRSLKYFVLAVEVVKERSCFGCNIR